MRRQGCAYMLLLFFVLAGCAQGRPKEDVVDPPAPSPVENPKEVTGPPVQIASDAIKRVLLPSPGAITATGTYSFHLDSGEVESYKITDPKAGEGITGLIEANGRWVLGLVDTTIYLNNRSSGQTYSFDGKELQVVSNQPDRLLLAGKGALKGQFWVTDESFKARYAFTLDLGQMEPTGARFAPDGKSVAIAAGRSPAEKGQANAQVQIVDLGTGRARAVADLPDGLLVLTDPTLASSSPDLLVHFQAQVYEPTGLQQQYSYLYRYDWQGGLKSKLDLPGQLASISPDGKRALVNQDLNHLASAAVVLDVATGKPDFRVDWAGAREWLADGSALLLGTGDGDMFVSLAGVLAKAPRMPTTTTYAHMSSLRPSPTNPDQFAAGMALIDRTGKVLKEIKLPKGDWLIQGTSWTENGKELLFSIYPMEGKDGDYGDSFHLPPKVERPPFKERFLLQVKDPAGECLNLRETDSIAGRLVRCLPNGTKLAPGDLFQAPMKLNQPIIGQDGKTIWIWVETERGEKGFVTVSTGSVTWAD
jgi:hypothetical protein